MTEKLFTLLSLQRQTLEATSGNQLSHIIINETHKIIPYDQAILWHNNNGTIILKKASGNVVLDQKSPFAIEIKQTIKSSITQNDNPVVLDNGKTQIFLFKHPDHGHVNGGVLLTREAPFQKAEIDILSEAFVSYNFAFHRFYTKEKTFSQAVIGQLKSRAGRLLILLSLVILFCLPVRLSVTAPMEIVAQNPFVITSPQNGMIENIAVNPGDIVAEGQILFELKQINSAANLDKTQEELNIAEKSLSRLRREALSNPEKRVQLKQLEADIALKKIEMNYAQTLDQETKIQSPISGTTIFSDKNNLQGRPVKIGHVIMMIADDEKSEILIRIPSQSMIDIREDIEGKFYLNIDPLTSYPFTIKSIGYQASLDDDNSLSYKIRGEINPEIMELMTIGWQGTAKLYSDRTILIYTILRRPILAIRNAIGF